MWHAGNQDTETVIDRAYHTMPYHTMRAYSAKRCAQCSAWLSASVPSLPFPGSLDLLLFSPCGTHSFSSNVHATHVHAAAHCSLTPHTARAIHTTHHARTPPSVSAECITRNCGARSDGAVDTCFQVRHIHYTVWLMRVLCGGRSVFGSDACLIYAS